MAGIYRFYTCCWMLIPLLDHVTIYSSLYYLYFIILPPLARRWALSIRFLRSVPFQGANSMEPTVHANTRIRSCCRTGIGLQVHQLWRWICKQTRFWRSPPSPTYIGTACADPSNIQWLSPTPRPDVSVGILRQHRYCASGAWMYILLQPFTSYISLFNHCLKLKSQQLQYSQ